MILLNMFPNKSSICPYPLASYWEPVESCVNIEIYRYVSRFVVNTSFETFM